MANLLIQQDPGLERKRRLAETMMSQGMRGGPVQHPMEGIGRIAQTLAGAYIGRKADESQKAQQAEFMSGLQGALASGDQSQIASILAGGGPQAQMLGLQEAMQDARSKRQAESARAAQKEERDYQSQVRQEARAHDEKMLKMRLDAQTEGRTDIKPAQKAVDKAYAKPYIDWKTTGRADTLKGMEQLATVQQALEGGEEQLTGPFVGTVPDWAKKFVGLGGAIDRREMVEEVVQRNLKAVLGGQFAQREGEQLIKRAYNENLDESVNAERVGRLLNSIKVAAEEKDSAAQYYEENGTLQGWTGRDDATIQEEFRNRFKDEDEAAKEEEDKKQNVRGRNKTKADNQFKDMSTEDLINAL